MEGISVTALYYTVANMGCRSCTCFAKLKDHILCEIFNAPSVHSATGHDLCPMGLIHCGIVLAHTQFMHIFIVFKMYRKNLLWD